MCYTLEFRERLWFNK